jgi:hypothetical protein
MPRNVIQPIQQGLVLFDMMALKLIEFSARYTRAMKILKGRVGSDWQCGR